MFDAVTVSGPPPGWTEQDQAAQVAQEVEEFLRTETEPRTWGNTEPSGMLALELDADTVDPAGLSDAELIDAVVGFERLAGWAQARQARLLAEFARRRPGDDNTLVAQDKACALGAFAPDEVGLALQLSRMTAKARLCRSAQLEQVLPETLAAWQAGRLDERRVIAICDATHYLPEATARAVQQRVLGRAPEQTLAQLKAALRRAVLREDPDGSAERHRAARRDRRVAVGEEQEGMASLWALLSAPDAHSCYQWLTRLAQGCGKDDPRGMDARRADLLVALLTGALTYAAPDPDSASDTDSAPDTDSASDTDGAPDTAPVLMPRRPTRAAPTPAPVSRRRAPRAAMTPVVTPAPGAGTRGPAPRRPQPPGPPGPPGPRLLVLGPPVLGLAPVLVWGRGRRGR